MRRLAFIMFLLAATVFVVAGNMISPQKRRAKGKAVTVDSLPNPNDTTQMDSLEKAVWLRNKAVDDSIHLDSLNKQKKNSIEMPVDYTANDSMVYDATSRKVHLFGKANVKYEGMDFESEKIAISLDSSIVHATGVKDTAKKALSGTPVFKMGNDSYESDTIAFNFKSKKGLINNVKTEQQEGYITSQLSKRMDNGDIYLQHGRYTTCDKEHPDFYIALSRAKVRPNKDVVFGPAYLVVADVPLPLAIPYGFFPFTKHYSSGFIMPTYGDENDRGFYLRDGGYYFAMSDKWDLKLLGEIYTKGSWGISAASNYNKRYKYSGSVYFSYQNTKTGDKGMPDYTKQESFKIQWSHRQDAKANPFSTLAASVNFATSSYERNNLNSMYNPQTMTQSTRTSSVSWSTGFSSLGMTLSSSANLSQNMRTNELSMTLPDLNVNVSRFYPFRRKQMVGKERWYEKISMSYTGQLSNSITTNEDHLLHSDLAKEWSNGIQHNIPVNGNFTLAKYINITLGFNFTDRMYFKKENMQWDQAAQAVAIDTTYGFYNVYNWNASIGASTKFYGMFIPNRKIFGDKIQAIRHVFTPTVSFSYAPDFGNKYYETYQRTNSDGSVELVEYSPYRSGLYSVPGKGKTGSITMQVSNNIEMKIRSDKDSTGIKKISIIDELGAQMSYNFATSYHRWSDLSTNLRLKWWKNYTFNLNAVFATYAYELDKNGHPYVGNHTEYSKGRFGRFQGMSQNISFTLTPDKLKKLFGGSVDDNDNKKNDNDDEDEGVDTDIESNVDDNLVKGQHGAKKKSGGSKAETDDDGYMRFSMPWSLTVGDRVTQRGNTNRKIKTQSMR
ncbi:MAG: putative LPS assembly protein LptD [Prevotella sp.]